MGGDDSISIGSGSYRRNVLIAALAVAGALAWIAPWRADAELSAESGRGMPLRIAIVVLAGDAQDGEFARDMAQGISANLERGGWFAAINSADFKEEITNFDSLPRFSDWRAIDAQVLVVGRAGRGEGDRYDSRFRLWDVISGVQLLGQLYVTSIEGRGELANHISDVIHERLIGKRDRIK
jgi:TolB protein